MYSYGILKLHAALTRQTVENGRRAARISRTAIARGWATRALRITVWRFVYPPVRTIGRPVVFHRCALDRAWPGRGQFYVTRPIIGSIEKPDLDDLDGGKAVDFDFEYSGQYGNAAQSGVQHGRAVGSASCRPTGRRLTWPVGLTIWPRFRRWRPSRPPSLACV
jgi:hypothetical protein